MSGKPTDFRCALRAGVAQVSTSAYYAWAGRHHGGPSPAELGEAYLVNAMIDIQTEHFRTYGWRRMTAALRRAGWPVNHKKIARLMRENRLSALVRRHNKRTTIPVPNPPVVPSSSSDSRPRQRMWPGAVT